MPVAAFVPGGLIKSSDHNQNYSDIATALTQSLATTGVSTMTAPLVAAAGLVGAPGYTFNGATHTGFYLAGTDQIGWAAAGVQGATFNSDTSVTFVGNVSSSGGAFSGKGAVPISTVTDYAGATAPTGWLFCFGQLVSTTTYASLFSAIGTLYGSGPGTFGIPDYRGRVGFGLDNMGGVAANRITVAGGNFDGGTQGNTGGGQNHTLIASEIPSITSGGSNTITVNSGAHSIWQDISGGSLATGGSSQQPNLIQPLTSSGINAINVTSNNTSGALHTILNPAIIVRKIIFAGV